MSQVRLVAQGGFDNNMKISIIYESLSFLIFHVGLLLTLTKSKKKIPYVMFYVSTALRIKFKFNFIKIKIVSYFVIYCINIFS